MIKPLVGDKPTRRSETVKVYNEGTAFLALLRACTKNKDLTRGITAHDEIIKRGLLRCCSNSLIIMYARCGVLDKAKELLNTHKSRDPFVWTALIAGYTHKGQYLDALSCFEQMQHEGIPPNPVTFTCILKSCGNVGAADRGEEIHDRLVKQGLLKDDTILGTAVVNMYAKCGDLAKAQEVLENLQVRDVISWNTLIAGYAQQGQGEQALNCCDLMQQDGLSPNAVTFICALKACGNVRAAEKGAKIHDEISKQNLLDSDVVLATALVDMYAKCGDLSKAQQVLDELPLRDVISWNALIAGYAQEARGEQAWNCLERMQLDGLSPDETTFVCMLQAVGTIKAVEKGDKVYNEIIRRGLQEGSTALGTAVVDMYAKCGALGKAHRVLDELSVRNVVCWSALIEGHAHYGQGEQALNCLDQMKSEGFSPNNITLLSILKACGSLAVPGMAEHLCDEVSRCNSLEEKNIVLGNALIAMYARCGALEKAQRILDELPARDVISWNAMVGGYIQHSRNKEALDCFKSMQRDGIPPNAATFVCLLKAYGSIREVQEGGRIHCEIARQGMLGNDVLLGTALLSMYAKCGSLVKASQVLEELPARNVISWSAIIAGYAQDGQGEKAIKCLEQMLGEGLSPNAVTFMSMLKACGSMGAADKGKTFHLYIARQGSMKNNTMLGNSLMGMYAKSGALTTAQQMFDELSGRDVVSWNTLIAGFAQQHQASEALKFFEKMRLEGHSPDLVTFICILKACGSIGAADKGEQIHEELSRQGFLGKSSILNNALVDMYAKCGLFWKAQQVLQEFPHRSVVSWSILIAGCVQWGEGEQALILFDRMNEDGFYPDAVTFVHALMACGCIGAADRGEEIHDEIARRGLLGHDIVLGTALVDMYARCGAPQKAQVVIEELPWRDVVSWNALITGYAQQGQGEQALKCLECMQDEGLSPDAATFISLLSACSLLSLVDAAQMYFETMSARYGVKSDLEHFTCIIDLFGRAGHLDKAVGLIQKMKCCSKEAWSALLGACQKWGDLKIGRWAFEQAIHVNESAEAPYTVMSNLYAGAFSEFDDEGKNPKLCSHECHKSSNGRPLTSCSSEIPLGGYRLSSTQMEEEGL